MTFDLGGRSLIARATEWRLRRSAGNRTCSRGYRCRRGCRCCWRRWLARGPDSRASPASGRSKSAPSARPSACAMPKSINLVTPRRSMSKLDGFTSRWTSPCSWACCKPMRGLEHDLAGVGHRQCSALRDESRRVFSGDELGDQEANALMASGVGGADDVRMVESADRAGFELEPRDRVGIGYHVRGDELDGDRPPEPAVRGFVHGAHAAGAEQLAQLVAQQLGPGRRSARNRRGGNRPRFAPLIAMTRGRRVGVEVGWSFAGRVRVCAERSPGARVRPSASPFGRSKRATATRGTNPTIGHAERIRRSGDES